jgi:CBS domain-containing protein
MFNLNLKIMKVKDLMTADALKHCTLETKLSDVSKILKEANHGALPVVDNDNKVIGIVTDRDVCLSLDAKKEKTISELRVKDAIPNPKIHTVKVDDSITIALQEMRKNKIGRLPVTDKNGRLVGLLSLNKLLSHAINAKGELGQTTSNEENLAKTIKSLFERNSSKRANKKNEELEIESNQDYLD